MKPISLFKDLARTGFHTSIITTYSVDAAFYDGSVFQRLRTYGCENAILMADKRMLDAAIEQTPESFIRGGTGYPIVPVALDGCFHPKLHIRLGADGGSLIVGSANATAAGWGSNREVVAKFEWWRHRETPDDAAVQSLIRKAFDFVRPWIEQADQASLRRKLELLESDASWLFAAAPNEAPVMLEDGTIADLFLERAEKGVGILRRLIDAVDPAAVKRLIIVSPYWDGKLGALKELSDRLAPTETVIALNARKPEFPVSLLATPADVRFAKVFDGSGASRFIHAKAIIIEAEDYDHLLLGSTNCSTNALGLFDRPASNAEASMYRRLPAGSAVEALGVDLDESIDPSLITAAPKERKPPVGPAAPWPGSIEAAGKSIRWRPAPELAEHAGSAKLKIGEDAFPFARERDGLHLLELPQLPSYPIIARVLLADGRTSCAVLVNDELRLQQAAPGMGNRKLRAALERIELGENDLLDLAALATLIFSTPEKARPIQQRGASAKASTAGEDPSADIGQDFNSPEDFRAAMESASPARGDDHRLNINGPDEVSLFRIIMRGMSAGSDDDLILAEQEPDETLDGDLPPTAPPPPHTSTRHRRVFTTAQVDKRRLDVFRAMKAFEAHLSHLAGSDAPPPRKITAETCFVLRLMVEASRQAMICNEGHTRSEIYALPLAPSAAAKRDETFVIRAGRMLHTLWVGSKSSPALLSRLQIGRHFDELPYDCFALVVMSRWAVARCVTSINDTRNKDLAGIVRHTAIQIWRATATWPPVDSSAELDFVRRLDLALGIEETETDELISDYQALSATLMPTAQAAE